MDLLPLLFIQALIFAGIGALIAQARGYDAGFGAALGGLFSLLGILALIALPVRQPQSGTERAAAGLKKCPDCAENIRLEAVVCRFCGRRFEADEVAEAETSAEQERSAAPVSATRAFVEGLGLLIAGTIGAVVLVILVSLVVGTAIGLLVAR